VENLARYIIRASFSQERMQYLDQEKNRLYIQRRQDKQELPRPEMAGSDVFAYPDTLKGKRQGRANSAVLQLPKHY